MTRRKLNLSTGSEVNKQGRDGRRSVQGCRAERYCTDGLLLSTTEGSVSVDVGLVVLFECGVTHSSTNFSCRARTLRKQTEQRSSVEGRRPAAGVTHAIIQPSISVTSN